MAYYCFLSFSKLFIFSTNAFSRFVFSTSKTLTFSSRMESASSDTSSSGSFVIIVFFFFYSLYLVATDLILSVLALSSSIYFLSSLSFCLSSWFNFKFSSLTERNYFFTNSNWSLYSYLSISFFAFFCCSEIFCIPYFSELISSNCFFNLLTSFSFSVILLISKLNSNCLFFYWINILFEEINSVYFYNSFLLYLICSFSIPLFPFVLIPNFYYLWSLSFSTISSNNVAISFNYSLKF